MSYIMTNELYREYPHLQFRRSWELTKQSMILSGQCEAYINAINNTPILPDHYESLMNLSLLKGAQATTAIEGNTLSEEDIRKVMEGHKLPPSREYQEIEVRNIIAAFNELLHEVINESADHFVTIELLKRFHEMVGKGLGEYFNAIPGQLRNSDVVVGNYRCPDYRDVPALLEKMCDWLKEEFGYGKTTQTFEEIIVQAMVTHVYIEWIHPFGDGNGRTGRLVEFYILLRGGNPDIASHILSNHYNLTRPAYYRQIEKATVTGNLTDFIEYALLGFRDGLVQTLEVIQQSQFQSMWQKLIYDRFDEIRDESREEVFKRQRTLALEMPLDKEFSLPEVPRMSVIVALQYASISEKTIQRDIEKLTELGLVIKSRSAYIANTDILLNMIARRRSENLAK
jgi:Fic family protein